MNHYFAFTILCLEKKRKREKNVSIERENISSSIQVNHVV